MERTELRKAFFAEQRRDPYLSVVTHHVANAWVAGYEQALRDHGLDAGETHGDRVEKALEWLTEASRRSQVDVLVALAELGHLAELSALAERHLARPS